MKVVKLLIWAGFALCALLWTLGAFAVAGLLHWGVELVDSGQAAAVSGAVMTLPIPVWVTHWVDLSVLHQALDAVASMLEALQRAWPWIGTMLQWLVPVTWVLWGLGVSVLLLLSAGAHLLMRRFKPAAAPTKDQPAASSGLVSVAAACTALLLASGVHAQGTTLYRGMCDASAAVALDASHFVVANDEDNSLRIFRRGLPRAVATLSLARYLDTTVESDLEGAAKVGQRIYWVSSHGRNSSGKVRTDRYRFFVTEVDTSTSPPTLRPQATPQANVLQQLVDSDALKPWRLADASRLAPEADGGLNIEGLADTADGQLLIGFRNPVREGKALVVTLRNPQQVAAGAAAAFGPPIGLDLGGRGVRALERLDSGYLVVAGPTADKGDFALYRWSGQAAQAPQRLSAPPSFAALRPEAIFAWPQSGLVQILSDDGGVETGGIACKDRPVEERAFRSIDFKP